MDTKASLSVFYFGALFSLCCNQIAASSLKLHTPSNLEKRETSDNIKKNCVDLLTIEKSLNDDGNYFTLRFKKNANDLIFRLGDNLGPEQVTDSPVDLGNGVWSVSFNAGPDRGVDLWLIVADKEYHTMFGMRLDNTNTTIGVQHFPDIPFLHVTPSGTVTYNPGQDLHFKAVVATENPESVGSEIYWMFSGINLDTGDFNSVVINDEIFDDKNIISSDNQVEVSVTFKTSVFHLSGYVQASLSFGETGGDISPSIQVSRMVEVHPSNQSGIFPPGYVGIDMMTYLEVSDNGNSLTKCKVGVECPMYCSGFGESISDIDVYELRSDGMLTAVPSAQMSPASASFARMIFWTFTGDMDSGDEDGITTFECQVRDDSSGNVVSKLFDVQTIIPANIVEEEASITVENVGIDGEKLITMSCPVRGRPVPDIKFKFPNAFYDSAPDNVTRTDDPLKSVATIAFREQPIAFADAMNYIEYGVRDPPSCSFYDYYGNVEKFFFDMNDL